MILRRKALARGRCAVVLWILVLASRVWATPLPAAMPRPFRRPPPAQSTRPAAEEHQPQFELSIEYLSVYLFRGHNVFQEKSQQEQKMVERPRAIWTIPRTRLFVGYSAAYQVNGDNIAENVDAGLGAEQDLFAGYEWRPLPGFSVIPELGAFVYPFAERQAAGTTVPLFFEASVELRYRTFVQMGIYAAYLAGIRRGPFSSDHFYLSPFLEKTFPLGPRLDLDLLATAGVKVFRADPLVIQDNMFDVLGTVALRYALSDVFQAGAKVGLGWTNLTTRADPETMAVIRPSFSNELVPFWGISARAEW